MAQLDRLSFTVGLTDAEAEAFARWVARSRWASDRRAATSPSYRFSWKLGTGVFVEYGDRTSGLKGSRLRVDYNPAHEDLTTFEGFGAFLLGAWRITRVDVCIDYDVALSEAVCLLPRSSKVNVWQRAGRLETLYLGSPSATRRFRIYDKRRERLDRDDFETVEALGLLPWWRVEVQHRPRPNEAPLPDDLFNGLSVTCFPADGLSFRDYAMVRLLQQDPSALLRVRDWSNRKALKERLLDLGTALDPDPSAVYAAALGDLRGQLFAIEMLARGGVVDAPEVQHEQ